MTDSKTAASAAPKPAETKATDQTGTEGPSFLAIGRLRRDLLIVAQGDAQAVIDSSKAAVLEGRAAEVFVVEAVGYFSESAIRWDASRIDTPESSGAERSEAPPLLNVHPSAAKSVAKAAEGESKLEPTTVQAERRKAAEASKTTAKLEDGAEAAKAASETEPKAKDAKPA